MPFSRLCVGRLSIRCRAARRIGRVLSVDPLYGAGLDALRERVQHNLNNCEQWLGTYADVIDWEYLGSPAHYRRSGLRSLASFSADFPAHPDQYLAASLPNVPLGDDTVDVALCVNFLFAYADTFDVEFHIAAIAELARVARSVRGLDSPHHCSRRPKTRRLHRCRRTRPVRRRAAQPDLHRTEHVASWCINDAGQQVTRSSLRFRRRRRIHRGAGPMRLVD